MQFDVLTLFPEIYPGPLGSSITGRAISRGLLSVNAVDLRNFTHDERGTVDDKPYEIFTGMMDKLNLPSWVEDGFIVRNKEKVVTDGGEEKLVSRYDLQYKDKDGFNVTIEGLSRTFNKEYWNYAKMISGFLRNNMPIPYVIKVISGLNLDTDIMNTWANGVVRALKRFVKQDISNTDEMNLDVCPECGKKTLKKDGSCCICLNCGYSKCG